MNNSPKGPLRLNDERGAPVKSGAYDGINILQDLATDGTVWTSYVQGIGIDKLILVSEWERGGCRLGLAEELIHPWHKAMGV